jgi:hypothetical protein
MAIYRSRMDKDWEFVAAFCADEDIFPMVSQAHKCQVDAFLETLKEAINAENDDWMTVWSPEPDWPCVWSDGSNSNIKDV